MYLVYRKKIHFMQKRRQRQFNYRYHLQVQPIGTSYLRKKEMNSDQSEREYGAIPS